MYVLAAPTVNITMCAVMILQSSLHIYTMSHCLSPPRRPVRDQQYRFFICTRDHVVRGIINTTIILALRFLFP